MQPSLISGFNFAASYEYRRDHPELPPPAKHVPGRYREAHRPVALLPVARRERAYHSLDTLAKIASAMDLPLSQFFAEGHSNGHKGLPQLSDDAVRFLSQMRRYAVNLNDSDRKLVLAMVKKMAASGSK
jgi:hypothetical protein